MQDANDLLTHVDDIATIDSEIIIYDPIDGAADPLAAWKDHAWRRGDLPREYLTRRVVIAPSQDEFQFLQRPLKIPADAAQREIERLAAWTYHVESGGVSTRGHGTYNDQTIIFHRHRANLIAGTVARMLGEQSVASNLLDLGCNCGFFTLDMAHRGIGSTLGIDLRHENIAQAEFLKQAFGVDNAEFRIQNVKDLVAAGQTFDAVLNLGLMYHLSTPYEIMRLCYEITTRFCVIDTITHTEPFSGYHVLLKNNNISIEGDLSFELQPTYRGILDTIKAAGFCEVIEIFAPVSGVDLYSDGSRRCLIAFKDDAEPYLTRLVQR